MLSLYRAALAARQDILTATADTSCTLIDAGDEIIAYTRPAADGRACGHRSKRWVAGTGCVGYMA